MVNKYSVTQFAALKGCTRQNIIKKIKKGTLGQKVERIGHIYVIFVDKKA